MNLEQRTLALLAVVAEYRQQRCAALLDPARQQVREQVVAALRDARRRVRTAIAEERKRSAAALAAAQAQLATERRLAQQRRAAARLTDGWIALRAALQSRWNTPAQRRAWIDTHLARAQDVLHAVHESGADAAVTAWRLSGPADWPAAERAEVAARLRALGARAVDDHIDPPLTAGFRVQAGHNVLDATLDGLLADRAAVQGRLLQLIEEPQ
ncbi:MAG: hypothetical protein MUC68_07755 [Burkholderiaceae bacterium]|jgi:hypothetical protein|nr:hypothetical protein [Burkholderiaceae bacterium]